MAAENGGGIADVDDEELKLVTRTLVDQPDVDADVVDRFFGQVQALAEDRARRGWPGEGEPDIAVFVRADYPRELAAGLAAEQPVADLIGTSAPLLGRIFVLDRNASQGFCGSFSYSEPGEILEWLAANLPGRQVVILYRETMLLIDRAEGPGASETRRETVRAAAPAASEESLVEALELFHREVLIPSTCPEGVWRKRNAQKYHPGIAPEKSIQACLKRFLNGWFRGTLRAEEEDTTEIGRIDIRLLAPEGAKGGLAYWGIVELKVVKSFRHPKKAGAVPATVRPIENARDIAEGVTQAHAFGKNRGAFAMVEVFDMRRDKALDPRKHAAVKTALAACDPEPPVRLTPIYGSAKDARNAGHAPGP